MTSPPAHHILLAMLGTRHPPVPEDFLSIQPGDWDAIVHMAKQHRLGPLLLHRFEAAERSWPVPPTLLAQWRAAARTAATRSLVLQHALATVQALFARSGIPSAALKGSWLAWQAYPNPALRPMRDIDLLVPDADAVRAHALILESGGVPGPMSQTPMEYARLHHKHMPPIFWGNPRVNFEIHWRISRPRPGEDRAASVAEHAAMLARRVEVPLGTGRVTCLDPTDTLFHLAIHAAHDHRLDNGPLILSDIAVTLGAADIDWARFRSMVEARGAERAVRLLFALVAEYHAIAPQWPRLDDEGQPSPALIAQAKALLVKEMDRRAEVYFDTAMAETRGLAGRAALLGSRAFPPRHVVAHYARRPVDSRWLWLWYPVRLGDYALRYLKGRGRQRDRHVADERALLAWLDATVEPCPGEPARPMHEA